MMALNVDCAVSTEAVLSSAVVCTVVVTTGVLLLSPIFMFIFVQ
jgi:hypothetical protein